MEEDDKIRLLVNEDIASNSQTENTYTGKNDIFVKETIKTSIRPSIQCERCDVRLFRSVFPHDCSNRTIHLFQAKRWVQLSPKHSSE